MFFKGIFKSTEKLESFFGANTFLNGDIDTKGTLRIEGSVRGKVTADWIILGEKASVNGDISAKGIVVAGKVEGNMQAKEIIEIKSKGKVLGDISTNKLTIFEGAIFDGMSFMQKNGEAKIIDLQAKGG
jgi:cytoskeletal protein CcmA (bactofilin family)